MWNWFAALDTGLQIAAAGVVVAAVGSFAAVAGLFKRGAPKAVKAAERTASEPPPAPKPQIGLPQGRPIVGRKTDLADLHQALCSGEDVALTNSGAILAGQGGIGKTTLARAYVSQHGARYDGTLWVEATSRHVLAQGICALNTHLGLERVENATPEDAMATLAALDQTGRHWLILYDNVESRDDLRKLIPQRHALIVTTRQGEGWEDAFTVQNTDVLPEGDALALLVRETQREIDDDAKTLAETLGHLPLALVIAGTLIRKERLSFAQAQTQIDKIIAREPKNADYPNSVIGAVRLSYEKLSDDAKLVADLFAWWAPEGLEARLITDAPGGCWEERDDVSDDVRALAEDPDRVGAAIEALEDRSLLRRDESGFAMHRMTAAALRAIQSEAPRNSAAAALLATVFPGGSEPMNSPSWPTCRRLTPYVRALRASGAAPESQAMSYLLNQVGGFLLATGDNRSAIRMLHSKIALDEKILSNDHRDVALGRANLGVALSKSRAFEDAEAELHHAVAHTEEHSPNSEDLASIYDMLGSVLLGKGRAGDPSALVDALRAYQRSAAIIRCLFPRLHDARANVLNNLGTVRSAVGQSTAALRLYEYALEIRKEILPEGDTRLALGYVNTGSVALRAGRADRAEGLLEQSMQIRRAAYTEEEFLRVSDVRGAARRLVCTYLVRARAGENAGLREAKARKLCDEFGFDFDQEVEAAKHIPYSPNAD